MDGLKEFSSATPLLLVGCGKMGSALLEGWLRAGLSQDAVIVVDPATRQTTNFDLPRSAMVREIAGLPDHLSPRMVLLAVKPQMMPDVLEDFAERQHLSAPVLTIAAGTRIRTIRDSLGDDVPVIRSMPNTPSAIGKGITAFYAGPEVSIEDAMLAQTLMETSGQTVWIEDEDLMDAVTGVSGSGPAYVFYMVEALRDAGIAQGLPPDVAAILARQMVVGAGALLAESTDTPETLRQNVTSPGGTTQAALDVLMAEDGLAELMKKAVAAATERGKQLSK